MSIWVQRTVIGGQCPFRCKNCSFELLLLLQSLTDLVTSMMGIALVLDVAAAVLVASDTRDQSLSRLTVGLWYWFLFKWKWRIPFLPKYPGWLDWNEKFKISSHSEKYGDGSLDAYNLFIKILWWCIPPARPLPAECFLCFPILPWPWETCPLSFLHFFRWAVYKLQRDYLIGNKEIPFLFYKIDFNNN